MSKLLESDFFLPLGDGKRLWCLHNAANVRGKNLPKGDVIILHGLSSGPFDYLYHAQARLLAAAGYNVWRPAMYWWEKDCRRLSECTMALHIADINVLLNKKISKKAPLYLVGHSYGAIQAMELAQTLKSRLHGVLLLDPSFNCKNWVQYLQRTGGVTTFASGVEFIVGQAMVDEFQAYDEAKCLTLASQLTSPTIIASAEKGILVKSNAMYAKAIPAPKKLLNVKGAGHCFWEGHSIETVTQATIKFWAQHGQ
jgi:pimeloyl-ACP methyl ester carboxylesterase